MKKLYYLGFLISSVFLMASTGLSAKCITEWEYLMPVTITNNASNTLSNYQVKVIVNTASLISAGKMISTGDDIRFVDPATCNNLHYWIESGINTSTTVIWVKLASLAGSGNATINMYYGNPAATAESSGDSTFIIFDDFNGSSLDTKKWSVTTSGSSASVSVSGGALNCSTTAEASIKSTSSFPSHLIEECNMTTISGSWESMAIVNENTDNGYGMWLGDYDYATGTTGPNTMWAGWTFLPNNPNCLYYTGHFTDSTTKPGVFTGIWKLSWPSSNVQYMTWPGGSITTTNSQWTLGSSVQIAVGNMCGATGTMSVDWIRARSYATSEPTVSNGQEAINHNSGIHNQNLESNISIYPNPAYDQVNIDLSKTANNFESLQWLDINSKQITAINIKGQTSVIQLKTNGMPKGVYFIKLIGEKGTMMQKFALE